LAVKNFSILISLLNGIPELTNFFGKTNKSFEFYHHPLATSLLLDLSKMINPNTRTQCSKCKKLFITNNGSASLVARGGIEPPTQGFSTLLTP
jgi:hypothetical protein